MADTINVPGMGATKKTTVYVAGAIGVVIIGVVWYRSRGAATDTSAAGQSEIDPATGYPYGSAEDQAALAAQAGYQSGGIVGGSSDTTPPPQQPTRYASNEQWKQAADAYLIDTVGLDGPAVSAALGKYLTGADVVAGSSDDRYIQQAIASVGYPPIAGVTGFPPSIHHTAAPPPTSPKQLPAPKLTLGAHRKGAAALSWTMVPGTLRYSVHLNGQPIPTPTSGRAMTVHKSGNYQVFAIAKPPNLTSGQSNNVTVKV